jgi:hypothetical protein
MDKLQLHSTGFSLPYWLTGPPDEYRLCDLGKSASQKALGKSASQEIRPLAGIECCIPACHSPTSQ